MAMEKRYGPGGMIRLGASLANVPVGTILAILSLAPPLWVTVVVVRRVRT